MAQVLQIAGVPIATCYGEYPEAGEVHHCVGNLVRIAVVDDQFGQPINQPKPTIGAGQQRVGPSGTALAAVECGGDICLPILGRVNGRGASSASLPWQILSAFRGWHREPNLMRFQMVIPYSPALPWCAVNNMV